MILFLDFDGVLHPTAPYMNNCGHFEHAQLLADLLEPLPHVRIVLSTSWVGMKGFSFSKKKLPASLQSRVIGATWHSSFDFEQWEAEPRFDQIDRYVRRHNVKEWIAIDDNATGWPEALLHQLVHTDEAFGLGDQAKQMELFAKLEGR